MKETDKVASWANLPLSGALTFAFIGSWVIASLMTVASVGGLLYPERCYPTETLRRSLMVTDVVNLVVGLPVLLGSMWLVRRGKLLGLLFWPGALFYVLYHYIVYTFGLPLNVSFVFSLVLLALSAYTMIGLLTRIDAQAVRRRLADHVPARFAGGVLVGLGVLFSLLALGTLANALVDGSPIPEAERALQVSDFITTQAWILCGVLLWRRKSLGYVTGAGLLFQASMLFVGLLSYFILQPFLTASSFPVEDFVVVFVMGLVCFIPFGLFVRGVVSSDV